MLGYCVGYLHISSSNEMRVMIITDGDSEVVNGYHGLVWRRRPSRKQAHRLPRCTMIDDECIGPHDCVPLIMYDGRYKFMVYEHQLKEGAIQPTAQCSEVTSLLAQMNDSRWVACPGIAEYSQYQSAIGYDIH